MNQLHMPNISEKEFRNRLLEIDRMIEEGLSPEEAFKQHGFLKTEEEIRKDEKSNLLSKFFKRFKQIN